MEDQIAIGRFVNKSVTDFLAANGMSLFEAKRKAELFGATEAALPGVHTECAWWVPGRIEVLGKHTDYAGGRSLLCAAERGICITAQKRNDSKVKIVDVSRKIGTEFDISSELEIPEYGWSAYPRTVARRIARNFTGPLNGCEIAFASDLPGAAGMSSSSALVTAIFTVLCAVNDLENHAEYREAIRSPLDLAAYLGCIENGQSFGPLAGDLGVGTFGGSEDHTAILCCRPGHVSQFSFGPIQAENSVPLPDSHIFVIACSGVLAPKTGSAREKYNRVSMMAKTVLEICKAQFHQEFPNLASIPKQVPQENVVATIREAAREDFTVQELVARFEQFYAESAEIIPAASAALEKNDLMEFGELVDRSQRGAEEGLGNQVTETIALARIARSIGADASSAFGAGFGGGVWALVSKASAGSFTKRWKTEYQRQFPNLSKRCEFFVTNAGPALLRMF
jgi:galactokinase